MKTADFTTRLRASKMLCRLGAIAAFALVLPSVGSANPSSCHVLIEQTLPRPEHPYRVTITSTEGGQRRVLEGVYTDGHLYTRESGAQWHRTPVKTNALRALARSTMSDCRQTARDTLDGRPMLVWDAVSVTPFTSAPSPMRIWIGAADGLVHRQRSAEEDQRIFYDQVVKPEWAETRGRRLSSH